MSIKAVSWINSTFEKNKFRLTFSWKYLEILKSIRHCKPPHTIKTTSVMALEVTTKMVLELSH